ncbi:S-layer homology domain-containing protein [Paenibacillus sp. GP183]|uniref:S-layer homology domain-containing protein n=1 Tax=Paenibacillus sp. GP183 TaxID=1882751 RepID=UPI000894A2FC|nr:S-layer homology domain-containing protein [Paenibacillus sp. GP183]SEC13089.1 S-layer homology domain-containing protein [Paenibacillus sp. GP183]
MKLPNLKDEHATNTNEWGGSRVKTIAKKKIAQVVAFLMLVSILLPVIAYGATGTGIMTGSYSYNKTTGAVTATVYSDVYDSTYGNVKLNVIAPNGTTVLKTISVPANYTVTANVYYFNITGYIAQTNVYDAVYLEGDYHSSVSARVYASDSSSTGGTGSPGGTIPPQTPDNSVTVDVPSNGDVNGDNLKKALADKLYVTLALNGSSVAIPATALIDAVKKPGATIIVLSQSGSITIPLSTLDLNALALFLGVDLKDLKIVVTISGVSVETALAVNKAAQGVGGTILGGPLDFKIEAVGANGKKTAINFGNTYISRTMNYNGPVDPKKVTVVLFNESLNKVTFVPSTFSVADGKTVATAKRTGTSIYALMELNKGFTDIVNHWSREDVQLLANKIVIDGMTDTTFAPDRNITRAEFAALVVRSLGIDPSGAASEKFSDVKSSDWFVNVVGAAAKANLIDGYEDGTFRPDAQINREELATMVIRAMRYAGMSPAVSASQQDSLLSSFTDAGQIVFAKAEIAAAINAGVINGMTDSTIGPRQQATRAQSAVMLKRYLSKAAFIN